MRNLAFNCFGVFYEIDKSISIFCPYNLLEQLQNYHHNPEYAVENHSQV